MAVVNVTEGNVTVSNLCDSYVGEDPWGGCPIAAGDIYSVFYAGSQTFFDFNDSAESTWENYYVKFKGGDCVNTSYSGGCVDIVDTGTGSFWNAGSDTTRSFDYLIIAGKTTLVDDNTASSTGKKCSSGNWYYVYKNSDCKS